VQNSIEMAITDPLTGLHNRRYMESHLSTLAEQADARQAVGADDARHRLLQVDQRQLRPRCR
jgi:GGDEF domain-containing protein